MERISTGNEQTDRILNGGFPQNSIHLIMGEPGTGKTIFAEQLIFANAGGERPLLYLTTLSEPLAKFIAYLQVYTFADPKHIGTEVIYEDLGAELAEHPEKLGERVLALIQQHRPRILVIDSFKAIAELLMTDGAAWRRTVSDLAGLLTAYSVTSFWVGEYTAEMVTHRPEFAVADGIVELVREQRGTRDERYLRVVKLRGSDFLDGYHAFRITAAGLEVSPRLITPSGPLDYAPSTERLGSGIAGLDEMIATGWLRGTSTLVGGPSGAGKTVLALHFLRAGVERQEPGLLVNFQENPTQLVRLMHGFGWEPETLLRPDRLDMFCISPVELQIDSIVTETVRRIEAQGVRRVVIDALGDLQRAASDQQRFLNYIYTLIQLFARRDITAMFAYKTAELFLSVAPPEHDVGALCDNILILEMDLQAELTRRVRVIKSRGSAHDGRAHVLQITSQGISVE
jgi:circadian clock protein KaiC